MAASNGTLTDHYTTHTHICGSLCFSKPFSATSFKEFLYLRYLCSSLASSAYPTCRHHHSSCIFFILFYVNKLLKYFSKWSQLTYYYINFHLQYVFYTHILFVGRIVFQHHHHRHHHQLGVMQASVASFMKCGGDGSGSFTKRDGIRKEENIKIIFFHVPAPITKAVCLYFSLMLLLF